MSPRRLLSLLVAGVVAFVYFYVVWKNGDRQKQMFADALAVAGCADDAFVIVGVDAAKGRVEGTTTYATSLVSACGAKWEIELARGAGASMGVTKTTRLATTAEP